MWVFLGTLVPVQIIPKPIQYSRVFYQLDDLLFRLLFPPGGIRSSSTLKCIRN